MSRNRTITDSLTVSEVAAEVRVHPKTVLARIHDGSLPALKVGRVYRIRRSDLDALLTGR